MGRKKTKSAFWINEEMNALMSKFVALHNIDRSQRTVELKPGIDKGLRNQLYQDIYIKHWQMAEVVLPKRYASFETRCTSCVAKLYQIMLFNWDPAINANSYGYFYRTAYCHAMDWLKGRQDECTDLYAKNYTSSGKIVIKAPAGETIEDYVEWLSQNSEWKTYKIIPLEDGQYQIRYTKIFKPFVSFDNSMLQIAAPPRSIYSSMADNIDFQVLSEYIPDVDCNETNKELAYIFLECLEEIINNDEILLNERALTLVLYEMIQSRSPMRVTRTRMKHVRNVVRLAYKYYAEEELDHDDVRSLSLTFNQY